MIDRLDTERHPVTAGLLALVGVALVVGLILGLVALAGARVMGVDGDTTSASTAGGEASMYLPKPERTTGDNGPEITLAPGQQQQREQKDDKPREKKSDKEPKRVISLSAGQTSVSPMQQIDLTGIYPGGEGAILQVQRFESGRWTDFPASPVTVSDQTFATYVLTGRSGVQRFRVVDTSTGKPSNEVRVTVG